MPTEPFKKILDRERRKFEANQKAGAYCPMLEEIVNYGTNVLARCESSANSPTSRSLPVDAHLPILILYRNVLSFIDVIESHIHNSLIDTVSLPLRGAFEAFLQLKWMLKEDTMRRTHSYLVFDIYSRIKKYRSLDLSSAEGKQAQAKIRKDIWAKDISLLQISDLDQRTQNLESVLTHQHYDEVNTEYLRYHNSKWYSLFSGPKNLEQLAEKL